MRRYYPRSFVQCGYFDCAYLLTGVVVKWVRGACLYLVKALVTRREKQKSTVADVLISELGERYFTRLVACR